MPPDHGRRPQIPPGRRLGPTNPFAVFPPDAVEQSIPERFEQQVRQYPDRLAIKTRQRTLTYEALNREANRIARAILAQRGPGEEPIALLLGSDTAMVAATFGVLKTGKLYVSLDPALSPLSNAAMLNDVQAGLVVTSNEYVPMARSLVQHGPPVLDLDALGADLSPEDLGLSLSPDTLASIYYTSGSTGRPKGVVHSHRNLLHAMMMYTNSTHISASDRLTHLHSYSFTASLSNLFGALLNGAAMLPFNLSEEGITRLAAWLIEEGLTIYYTGTSVFRQLIGTLTGEEQFPALRLIRLVGESLTSKDVESYRRHFSADCLLVNMLGSAETLSVRQYFLDKTTPLADGIVPVGYACEGVEVLLLDEDGAEVKEQGIGEIAVKSRYLACGYWRQPALTDAAFLPDPAGGPARLYRTGDLGSMRPDGCLIHLGRKDSLVKVRGYRVEIAEVELALLEHPAIKEVAVVAREDQAGGARMVAYLVARADPGPSSSALRGFLAERLPDYMIPSAFVTLRSLPMTPTNKVDRRTLPAPDRARPVLAEPFAMPRTPLEERLARIWAEVLDLEQVGIHDNFLDLGGHSLLATQIVARVCNVVQADVPLRVLLEASTVARMALAILQERAAQMDPEALARLLTAVERPSEDDTRASAFQAGESARLDRPAP